MILDSEENHNLEITLSGELSVAYSHLKDLINPWIILATLSSFSLTASIVPLSPIQILRIISHGLLIVTIRLNSRAILKFRSVCYKLRCFTSHELRITNHEGLRIISKFAGPLLDKKGFKSIVSLV